MSNVYDTMSNVFFALSAVGLVASWVLLRLILDGKKHHLLKLLLCSVAFTVLSCIMTQAMELKSLRAQLKEAQEGRP